MNKARKNVVGIWTGAPKAHELKAWSQLAVVKDDWVTRVLTSSVGEPTCEFIVEQAMVGDLGHTCGDESPAPPLLALAAMI